MDTAAIYFFPLSEPLPVDVMSMPAGVLARRIPDFLCTLLNDDGRENASLLEIRAADSDGVPTGEWANFEEIPEPQELFQFLPDADATRLVCGTLRATRPIATGEAKEGDDVDPRALELTLLLVEREAQDLDEILAHIEPKQDVDVREFTWRIDLDDIGGSILALAKRLAGDLDLVTPKLNWRKLVSSNSEAFCQFMNGLDGSAQLDPALIAPEDPVSLLAPFVQALKLDPDFGLALRRLHLCLHGAVDALMISPEDAFVLLDEAYSAFPSDSEGASSLGEHLAQLGEDDRAEDWLRLSINQPNPPPQSLEALGILLANRGEFDQARNLWRTGVRVDGHPDFFAHLARLAFRDDQDRDAWEYFYRGLRRIAERSLHPGEWMEDSARGGVILRYLSEHLAEFVSEHGNELPEEVEALGIEDLLLGLTDQIREPEDRLDLGLCLIATGHQDEGVAAIRASLPHVEDPDRRDLGADKVARALFPDFDERLERCAEAPERPDDLDEARAYFERVSEEVPQLWPAWYLRGRLEEHAKDWEAARQAYRKASSLRRDQTRIFSRLAVAAAQLQEFDEAVEALETALELSPSDAGLHADHALLLHYADRHEAALEALEIAETLGASNEVVQRVQRLMSISGDPADMTDESSNGEDTSIDDVD